MQCRNRMWLLHVIMPVLFHSFLLLLKNLFFERSKCWTQPGLKFYLRCSAFCDVMFLCCLTVSFSLKKNAFFEGKRSTAEKSCKEVIFAIIFDSNVGL